MSITINTAIIVMLVGVFSLLVVIAGLLIKYGREWGVISQRLLSLEGALSTLSEQFMGLDRHVRNGINEKIHQAQEAIVSLQVICAERHRASANTLGRREQQVGRSSDM